jgi:hypothetical protein
MPGGTGISDTYIGIILIYAWWYWNTGYLYRHYSHLCLVVLEYSIPISALFSFMPGDTGISDTYIGIILIYARWYWNKRYLYRHYSHLCLVVLEYSIPISAFSFMPGGTGILGIILIYA